MKDRLGSIIYVGKARDLRKRLSSYFMPSKKMRADLKTRALIDSICDFEIHVVRNEPESLLLEGKLIKQYRPRYNVAFRDDKRFLLVRINPDEPWPKFTTTRLKKDDGARYFGPFAHSGALRGTLAWLHREFGLRTCAPRVPGETDYRHCNADVIRNCTAPCVGKIERADYLARVEEACTLLEGKGRRERLKGLKEEMEKAAARMDFERAAKLRDIMQNLEKTLSPTRQFTRGRGVPTTVKPTEDLAELGELMGLPGPPEIMECFDISNISDTHIVASMVRFRGGAPDNQNYRRYRIKGVTGQDDFASMAEVVRRRYARILAENSEANPEVAESQERPLEALRRLAREGKSPITIPDLVIVDGGKGQLSAAVEELNRLGLGELTVVGLAKQREEIFFPGESEPLLLSHETGALKLMQRIRDEAHRFANGYNELLLRKRMKESLLDDCPGVSPRRKAALLKKFGSVARVREATVEEIAALPGFSEKTAESILEWLVNL
ncbi:excinuclease ABC subunit UvrC [Roseibacillus ishigakijimensis]|uniref:Excinuclease ABC subunit UvrC n=2 Tax=Roseibacillus ishigakijimensis TaxID=454146 RepID=A0A934RLL2_9BACT|nr:excinuclease ABC subunit UvrC [Roseibacillus ishigakijimensis]